MVRASLLLTGLSWLGFGCQSSELLLVSEQLAATVPRGESTSPTPMGVGGARATEDIIDSGVDPGPEIEMDSGVAPVSDSGTREAGVDAALVDAGRPALDAGDGGAAVIDVPVDAVNLPDTIETDPSFTADLLELYFMSTRDGSKDLFRSLRASADEPWGSAERVEELTEAGQEENPFVSADGLTLWFFTDRDRALGSIWYTTRALRTDPWAPPTHATGLALAEGGSDVAVTADSTATRFLLNSKTPGASPYGIHEFALDTKTSMPTFLRTLTEVNGETDEFDPDMREAGLFVAFDSARNGPRQVFWTRRPTLDDPFAVPTQLTAEPAGDESAPAFSEDLTYLMFSSTRSGVADIYERRLEVAP